MLRLPPEFKHLPAIKKRFCINCKAERKYVILCGDCWRIGVQGIAVGGALVGGAIALVKHFF